MNYSYSSIKQYQNCPKAFLHRYVKRDVREDKTTQRSFGDDAHKSLQAYSDFGTAPIAGTDFCKGIIDRTRHAPLRFAEKKMGLSSALTPVEFLSSTAWLRGVVDYMAIKGESGLLFDWKFGKRRPDKLQLRLMALLVFHNFPDVQAIRAALVWETDRALDLIELTRNDLPALARECIDLTNTIEVSVQHNNWPLTPSGLCGWCPVDKTRCPYGRDVRTVEDTDDEL